MTMFDETMFECSVCLEYFENPKQLNCGHSLCEGCVERICFRTSKGFALSCPECKTVVDIPPKGLPTNYPLRGLTDKFKAYARLEMNCTYCASKKIAVCEECVGNNFQLLAGNASKISGRWELESQKNFTAFLSSIGIGFFGRLFGSSMSRKHFTILELGGSNKWLFSVYGWFSSSRWLLRMNEPVVLEKTKMGTHKSTIRYNVANDSFEQVDTISGGLQEPAILYQITQRVVNDKLVIAYLSGEGVQAERVFKRLPMDLERL
ncbi:hypothetical protein QR680_004893 [Steinernema hermaphroditum]|uniref:RING-type domain-containing protein n=1 Tax=Steinernema hermaphroditum TaxID=289476 RepID=A0AA39HQ54_9BILA|nr:hypothetical protein QR680_004893 [Steinernema hermaphroditum]